jgi:tetratricopeptide (TPR) repeat protein
MNRLGKAATLLNTQPRTTENIAAAREILLDLSQNQPQNSTLGNLSQFLLARIDENYLTPPQNDEAKSRYLEIVKSKTGVPLLELSASRLVALTTFASDKASDNLAALSTLEPLANFLSTPEGIREFHLAMGLAILENEGDPNLILDHLIKAETIGFRRKENVIQNWLVIGRLGEKIGNKTLAAKYYQKFIDHFPNDPKTFGIKHRLTSLTQNGTN